MLVIRSTLFIILLLFIFNLFVHDTNGQQCTSGGMRKADAQVAKVITIGNSGRRFPESKGKELKIYCDETKVYIKDIEKFKNKCLKNLPKQVGGVLIYTVKGAIKQLCNKQSKKLDQLISSTKCINTGTPEINKCYTNILDNILGIANADERKKIPHLCCEYYSMFPCIRNRLKRVSICSEEHIETVLDFVKSIMGNVVDLLCGDYVEGSDKCDKLGPSPKKLKSQRRAKSFFIPIVEMLDSFPEV